MGTWQPSFKLCLQRFSFLNYIKDDNKTTSTVHLDQINRNHIILNLRHDLVLLFACLKMCLIVRCAGVTRTASIFQKDAIIVLHLRVKRHHFVTLCTSACALSVRIEPSVTVIAILCQVYSVSIYSSHSLFDFKSFRLQPPFSSLFFFFFYINFLSLFYILNRFFMALPILHFLLNLS